MRFKIWLWYETSQILSFLPLNNKSVTIALNFVLDSISAIMPWDTSVMVTFISQLHSAKPELRLWASSNFCLWHVGDSRWQISLIGLWWAYEHSRYLLYKLANLINWFDNLSIWRFDDLTIWRFEILSSELAVSKNFDCLLREKIIKLRKNAVNNAQYYWSESIEISSVPASISNEELEDNVCEALCLSLTGHDVIPDDFQGCHRLKKRGLWL